MNRITRMLTMSGLGLVAGATMVAGPAMASAGAGQSVAQSSSSTTTVQDSDRWGNRDRVVGVYRSYRACVLAGRIGERFDRWEDFDCERRGFGFRTRYVLEVEYRGGWWGHDDDDNDGWWGHNDRHRGGHRHH